MPNPQSKWGCGPGDEVKHFYLPSHGEWVPCCDRNGTIVKTVSGGGSKPKCLACVENEKGCT